MTKGVTFSMLLFVVLTLTIGFIACSEKQEANVEQTETMAATGETESVEPWNKVCPICGDDVQAGLETVEYDGKVYGFGCAGCPGQFRENPEKFVGNLSEDGTEFIGG